MILVDLEEITTKKQDHWNKSAIISTVVIGILL
jgi:hypothetical protein